MLQGLYYIAAKNSALKRFTGLNDRDLTVLIVLCSLNAPCHYSRLYDLLNKDGNTIAHAVLTYTLRRNQDNKLITRTPIAGNVVYCITLEGRKLLHSFSEELNSIVGAHIRRFGNGFPE